MEVLKLKKLMIALLLVSMVLAGCSAGAEESDSDAIKEQVSYVKVSKPIKSSFEETTMLPGTLVPKNEGIITAKVSGVIEGVHAELGDMVDANEVLCEIEPESYTNIHNKAKLAFENIQTSYDRMKELYENEAVSKSSYEEIETKYHSLKEDYELAKLNLANSKIKSPIRGIISSKEVLIGQAASPGMELFRVVDISELYVETGVTEKDISHIKEGQEANILTETGDAIKGTLQIIGPVPDLQTGTYPIKILVKNEENQLKAGMFVNVEIIKNKKENVLAIDKSAVLNEDGIYFVYVTKGNVASKRQIETGLSNENYIEVVSGVEPDEDVVISGQDKLREGSKVQLGE